MRHENDKTVPSHKGKDNNDTSQKSADVKQDEYSFAPQVCPGYRDFSNVETSTVQIRDTKSFPLKLHEILSNAANETSITWQPHGRSWRIVKPVIFEKEVLPLYFRSHKLSTFKHQLSTWGFRCIGDGADVNSYYHECFLRGLPHLCKLMRRLGHNQFQFWHAPYPQYSPDFYAVSRDCPLPEQTTTVEKNSENVTAANTNNATDEEVEVSSRQQLDETSQDHNQDQDEGPAIIEQYSSRNEEEKSESGLSSSQSVSRESDSSPQQYNSETSSISINTNNGLSYPHIISDISSITMGANNPLSSPNLFCTQNDLGINADQYSMLPHHYMPIQNVFMPRRNSSLHFQQMNQNKIEALERELFLRRQLQNQFRHQS